MLMLLPHVSFSSFSHTASSSGLTSQILRLIFGIHKCLAKGELRYKSKSKLLCIWINTGLFHCLWIDKGYESLFLHFIPIKQAQTCASHLQLLLNAETSLVLHSTTSFITFKRKYEPCLMVQFIGNNFVDVESYQILNLLSCERNLLLWKVIEASCQLFYYTEQVWNHISINK